MSETCEGRDSDGRPRPELETHPLLKVGPGLATALGVVPRSAKVLELCLDKAAIGQEFVELPTAALIGGKPRSAATKSE